MKPFSARTIRVLLFLLLLISGTIRPAAAQTYYAALPNAQIQFFDANGNPLASGKLYAYQAGTTTPQDTYTDSTGMTANVNPVILDSAGRAAIWLASTNPYKLVLKTSADVVVWTQDQVSDFGAILKRDLNTSFATKSLDGAKLASQYTGANAGAQFAAAMADAASSGGKISGVGLQGSQAITSDPFVGITKPIVLEWGAATYTLSTNVTVPSNVTLVFAEGSTLSVNNGSTLTINGGVTAPATQIFAGSGSVTFNTTKVDKILPQWWGAKADGSHDDAAAINSALTAATNPTAVFADSGIYKLSAKVSVPATVNFSGTGKGTKIVSAGFATLSTELVRLAGDYSSVTNMWLSGSGQVANTADGRRGIWIGCSVDYITPCNVNHALVQNVTIDQTTGNGISGDYTYAKILNNVITNTTDAGIFLQPTSTFNLIQGNTISGTRYSGIDCNGSDNRIVGNTISGNGGGNLDANSQAGILVTYIASSPTQPNASRNIIEDNRLSNNVQAGIYIYSGATTSGIVNAPFGTIIKGNIATGHTNQYDQNAGITLNSWGGGIVVLGGNDTTVEGNVSSANTFNYVVSGISDNTSQGNILTGNQSFNAVTNAALTVLGKPSGVGYFFPGSARLDAVGGSPATDVIFKNNVDRFSAHESVRWSLDGATSLNWSNWTIDGNHSDTAGTYGFRLVDPANFYISMFLPTNLATGAGTANYNGFATYNGNGLTQNSTTPSVTNAVMFFTQNTNPTTYTNFTGAAPNQTIVIRVADSNSTFNFNGTNLKGNNSSAWKAVSGDSLFCVMDGTNWQCAINHPGPTTVFANTNQATNKSTDVTQNGVLSGRITLHQGDGGGADQLAAGTTKSFNILNDQYTTGRDFVLLNISAGANASSYSIQGGDNGAGKIIVSLRNNSASLLDDQLVLDYEIRKR